MYAIYRPFEGPNRQIVNIWQRMACSRMFSIVWRAAGRPGRSSRTATQCHGAGWAVRTQVSKGRGRAGGRGIGRTVGRPAGQMRRRGGTGRAAEREREREIYSCGKIDRRLRGEERVPSTHPPSYGIHTRRALNRARASPGHHYLYIQERRPTRPSDGA